MKKSHLVTDEKYILNCETSNSNIEISTFDRTLPHGTLLYDLTFKENKDGYETVSVLTNMHERTLYNEKINSKVILGKLIINSPYDDYISIANELSIYLTMLHDILTLHASCCIKDSNCIVFLGRSNSGKSTSAEILDKDLNGYKMITDDHVHLYITNNTLKISTPIWDCKNINRTLKEWYPVSKILIVCLDKVYIDRLINLRRFTIGYSYNVSISYKILELIERLSSNIGLEIKLFNGDYKTWEMEKKDLI